MVGQFKDVRAYTIEEVAVVGDEKQALDVTTEVSFQPFDHVEVEVVGRFVEHEQVGFGQEHVGQSHTFDLSAGELCDRLVEIRDVKFREYLLGS